MLEAISGQCATRHGMRKKRGYAVRNYFSGKDPNVATIRLRVPIGIVYPEQLDILKEAALRYGDGRLHLTVRKTIEIPGVPRKDLDLLLLCSAKPDGTRCFW